MRFYAAGWGLLFIAITLHPWIPVWVYIALNLASVMINCVTMIVMQRRMRKEKLYQKWWMHLEDRSQSLSPSR